jgi:hypothetical protein
VDIEVEGASFMLSQVPKRELHPSDEELSPGTPGGLGRLDNNSDLQNRKVLLL